MNVLHVTNFIQLISPQPVDQFSQTKLCWKAPSEGYQHICGIAVATTRPMFNSSTSNKSYRRISSGEHELCNSQENSIRNHNSILPTIYMTIHGPCYDYASAVHSTLMSMPCSHVHY